MLSFWTLAVCLIVTVLACTNRSAAYSVLTHEEIVDLLWIDEVRPLLLKKYPACAQALAKYRINPGNVSVGRKDDTNFGTMVQVAVENQKPVRIGVNWGSLDQALLTRMMDENSRLSEPKDAREVTMEAMVVSALNSAALAEKYGLRPDQIILSAKVSGVQDLIDVYRELAARCNYPLHLGLTEAGMGAKGIVASAAALGVVLQEGIGDTIRVSLTPAPGVSRRTVATAAPGQ